MLDQDYTTGDIAGLALLTAWKTLSLEEDGVKLDKS